MIEQPSISPLSAPTHYQCWLDPVVFVERILLYQSKKEQPLLLDLAFAFTKLNFKNPSKALKLAQKLEGSLGKLVRFVLGSNENLDLHFSTAIEIVPKKGDAQEWALSSYQDKPLINAILYLNAFRSRFVNADVTDVLITNYEKNFNTVIAEKYLWTTEFEIRDIKNYQGEVYDHFKRTSVTIKSINQKRARPRWKLETLFLYDNLFPEKTLFSIDTLNIKLILSFLPNNSETVFAFYNKEFSRLNTDYEDVETNKSSRALLKAIIDFNVDLHEMGTLFLACSTTFVDKVSRGMAAEVAIHLINQNKLNLQLLGEDLGKLTISGYGRLQRIIPVLQQISEVSNYHAMQIQEIIQHMLPEFSIIELARNTKKLLELFINLSLTTGQKINPTTFERQLTFWKTKSGLKKIIKNIENT